MEKILKLLDSPCSDDCLIGVELLLRQSPDDIIEFFQKKGKTVAQSTCIVYVFNKCSLLTKAFYIEINEEYVIKVNTPFILLRSKSSQGFMESIPIVKINNYINGMY